MIVPTPVSGSMHFYVVEFLWDAAARQWRQQIAGPNSFPVTADLVNAMNAVANTLRQNRTTRPAPPFRWWQLWVWGYETTDQTAGPIPVSPGIGLPPQRLPARWLLLSNFGNWELPVTAF